MYMFCSHWQAGFVDDGRRSDFETRPIVPTADSSRATDAEHRMAERRHSALARRCRVPTRCARRQRPDRLGGESRSRHGDLDELVGPFDSITVFGGATVDRIAHDRGAAGHRRVQSGQIARGSRAASASTSPRSSPASAIAVRLVDARSAPIADGDAIIAAAEAAGVDTSGDRRLGRRAPTASYHAAFDDGGGLVIGIADMAICDEMTPAAVGRGRGAAPPDDFWVIDANLPADDARLPRRRGRGGRRGRSPRSPSRRQRRVRLAPLLDRLTLLFANRREAAALLGRDADEPRRRPASSPRELAAAATPNVVVTNCGRAARRGERRRGALLRAAAGGRAGASTAPAMRFAAGTIHGLASGRACLRRGPLRPRRRGDHGRERRRPSRAELTPDALAGAHRRRPRQRGIVKPLLGCSEEVADALAGGRPVVALETTIVSHGMPWPRESRDGARRRGDRARRPARCRRRSPSSTARSGSASTAPSSSGSPRPRTC